jgi:hypothetical protein
MRIFDLAGYRGYFVHADASLTRVRQALPAQFQDDATIERASVFRGGFVGHKISIK